MRSRAIFSSALATAALALVLATSTQGAVGVEKVSRHGGEPGASVTVTLGCGFCFPPCEGKPGHRNTPCMLGTKRDPPASFPISLVPIGKAPEPHPCGPNALCSPETKAPPARAPYSYLGEAVARERTGNEIPRYDLDFEVPDLPPGVYTYIVYCDVCNRGKGGSLIANPRSHLWRLRVR